MADGTDFQLSASLPGHDKDVRAVCFPSPETVFTSSRDCTVQVWRPSGSSPPTYSPTLLIQGPYSFNSLAYLPPSDSRPQYPNGLVLAGSQGQTIEVRKPDADLSEARVSLLTGHSSNVSALDVSPNGEFVVSGDWDGRVKLWNTATWELGFNLLGTDANDKQRAIWAVLAYSNTIVLTGSADHMIRGYSLQNVKAGGDLEPGVNIRTPDVVRALCRVRNSSSGAKIASAGNDFMIRLWQFNGSQVGVLQGHESFIYALDCLPTGELVSSSEDRTVRIWRGESCIQTITHPALSIWSVSVCQQTGDFATGASDNTARIFTRSQDRIASPAVLNEFSESVQRSAIPQQQTDVNPSTLPGPEFLETKAGTKDGQTVMINSGGGTISAHQWSAGQNQWLLVGTVVDSSQEGEAGGDSIGGASAPPTISEVGSAPPPSVAPSINHPMGSGAVFATLAQSNFTPVLKRITTVNGGLSEHALDTAQLTKLSSVVELLTKEIPQVPAAIPAALPPTTRTFSLDTASVELVVAVATLWPYKDRLAGLDLLRCTAVSPSVAEFEAEQGKTILDVLLPSVLAFPADAKTKQAEDVKSVENNSMMVLRLIANLFITESGQKLVVQKADGVVDFVSAILDISARKNRNMMLALTTAVSNMTAFALKEQETTGKNSLGREVVGRLIKILAVPILDLADPEVVYRALVALGNLASIRGEGGYVKEIQTANARTWVNLAVGRAQEDKVKSVGEKILALLA